METLRLKLTYRSVGQTVVYLLLIAGSVLILAPLVWMISTSLKEEGVVFILPPQIIPDPIVWSNYPKALTLIPFNLFFRNSALVTGLSIIGAVLTASIVAYSFARLRWWGRDVLFMVVLATMMLPSQITLIPQFVIFRQLGWLDTFLPLIVPYWGAGAFFVFLLRQFFMTIPSELDDAALIDGCNHFNIFYRIILPLSKPALAAVAIFTFQWTWNDFLHPLIYINHQEGWTVALALGSFRALGGTTWTLLMAAATTTVLPIILLFFFAQRYFIQGVVFTGVKG